MRISDWSSDVCSSDLTDVGNQAVAARVDRKLVPLRTKLVSGQKVEIVTAKSSSPKPQWLEFVVTGKARTAIPHQLKHLEHEDAVRLGHRMLYRPLDERGSSLERLPAPRPAAYLPRQNVVLGSACSGH